MWQKAYHKKHHYTCELVVGYQVLLPITHLQLSAGKEIVQRCEGPFRVLARVGKVAYRPELPTQITSHPVFHVAMLKPYNAAGDLRPQPPPESVLMARIAGI